MKLTDSGGGDRGGDRRGGGSFGGGGRGNSFDLVVSNSERDDFDFHFNFTSGNFDIDFRLVPDSE